MHRLLSCPEDLYRIKEGRGNSENCRKRQQSDGTFPQIPEKWIDDGNDGAGLPKPSLPVMGCITGADRACRFHGSVTVDYPQINRKTGTHNAVRWSSPGIESRINLNL